MHNAAVLVISILLVPILLINLPDTYSQVGMPAPPQIVEVKYGDKTFQVKVWLDDGRVTDITVDPEFTRIILTIEPIARAGGFMEVVLPRELIDAKTDGSDDVFFIFGDGDQGDYVEKVSTETERDIVIQLITDAKEIEIVGTKVVPEFPITVMVVMSAMLGIAVAIGRFVKV